jgi:hypothetical protein
MERVKRKKKKKAVPSLRIFKRGSTAHSAEEFKSQWREEKTTRRRKKRL